MSSSSRISDSNRLEILIAQIKKLQNIRCEAQVEQLIKTDPDWQVVFERIQTEKMDSDDKRAALEQVYQLVQEKRVELEQAKKELETLLHKQITHDERRADAKGFHGFAQDALFQHWLTFTDHAPEALSLVNVRFYNQLNDPMYWRLRLQNDFGMSSGYFSLITKNEDKMTAAAKMKMVHQRLSDLKHRSPHPYRYLYQPIIENDIEFPPLTATTIASLSAMDEGQVFFYLEEALRLQNNTLAENLLVMMFDELARFSTGLQKFKNSRCITITEKSKNLALLHKMAAIRFGDFNQEVFDTPIERINRQNAWSQSKLQSNEAGTLYLNDVIDLQQYQLARELLQTGVVPDANTLIKVLELTHSQSGEPHEFTYYVLSLSKQYPTMLCQVWMNEVYREALCNLLEKTRNTQLIQDVYDVFNCHLKECDTSEVLSYLLRSMVIQGDWTQLKPHLKSERLFSPLYLELMNHAIDYGQLALLKELISLNSPALERLIVHKDRPLYSSIQNCRHVDIIRYYLEELQLSLKPQEVFLRAVKLGNVAVVKYFVDQVSLEMRQTPTAITLDLAIASLARDVVQYLAEEWGMLPQQVKHIENALVKGNYDFALFLIRLRLKMNLSLNDKILSLSQLVYRGAVNQKAQQLFNWITGPEGRKHGFQFNINHLRLILNNEKLLLESMVLSPEFPGLFQQLEDKEKNALLTRIFRALLVNDNPLNIDRSMFSVCRMLVNSMKTEADSQWLSLSMKINLFLLALAYQDEVFAKIFLNQKNEFLYFAFSWDYFASHESLKFNAHQINPKMLAWLETELNTKIPDTTLNAILDQYVKHCRYGVVLQDAVDAQHQQAIKRIFLIAFNKHRDFRFRDTHESSAQEEKEAAQQSKKLRTM